jgi:DNA-binding GntR family transcriptional regulator
LAKGDPEGAERAMDHHMDRVRHVAKSLMTQYPEYFEQDNA